MRCSPELLDAYVDGELSARERRRVQSHMLRCPWCRREADRLRALKEALGAAADADSGLTPDAERRRIAAIVGRVRFQEARRQREQPRKRFWQGVAGGAAAAAAVAAVVIGLAAGVHRPGDGRQAYAATVAAVVSEHSRRAMLLEMGVDDWADWPVGPWEEEP